MVISSSQNPQAKRLVVLQRKRREREAAGVIVVEGHDEVAVALQYGAALRTLYICPELMGESRDEGLLARIRQGRTGVVELSRVVFEKVSYREGPDGWLAVAEWEPCVLGSLELSPRPLVLVLEAIEKPGNVGAMLRTAVAAGVDAVVCVGGVDLGNPNVIRASKGLVFAVPVVQVESLGEVVEWLRDRGIRLVAAALREDARLLWKVDLAVKRGVAIAVGEEHAGLSDEALAAADEMAIIPMAREMDSLNVATSAAILLYEAVRQRRG